MNVNRIRPGDPSHFLAALAALSLLAVSLGLSGCREAAVSDEAPNMGGAARMPTQQPYCLELYSSRSEVLLGEPVRLLVSLRNCTAEVRSEPDLIAPEYGLLSVWVQRPASEKEYLYSPPVRRNGRGRPSIELAPGEALNAELPVYFGSDGWVMDREGTYRIRAEYPIGKEYVQSETIELHVSAGDDPEFLAAAHAFMQPNASRFYFLTGGDEKGEYELEQLIKTYPDTIWASYSRLAVELNQVLSTDSASRRVPCRQLYDDAAQTLGSIPDIVTASNGYEVLVDCLLDAGLYDHAEKTRDKYYAQFPQAMEMQALRLDDAKTKDGG